MSVKNQRKLRQNSSARDIRQINHNIQQQLTPFYQYINCVKNKLQFNKKYIQVYGLNLLCECIKSLLILQQQNKNKFTPTKNMSQQYQILQNAEKNNQNQQYTFQIQGLNIHITKCQVKHTFTLQKYLSDKQQYLRFQLPQIQKFIIKSCVFSHNKLGIGNKLILISNQQKMNNNNQNCIIIKPSQLIQQNKRLRAQKLNKSVAKTFTMTQSVKKLNINWNKQQNNTQNKQIKEVRQIKGAKQLKNSILNQITINTNIQPRKQQKQLRNSSTHKIYNNFNTNTNMNYYNRISDNKMSVQKNQRPKSRSFSKSAKNLNVRTSNIMNNSIVSQKPPIKNRINSSYVEPRATTGTVRPKRVQTQSAQEEISSESYYTAQKNIQKQIQIPQRTFIKKMTYTGSKQNNYMNSSVSINNKQNYTQYKANRVNGNNLSSSTNLDPKRFTKNISQAKIAQVSRPLLQSKALKK